MPPPDPEKTNVLCVETTWCLDKLRGTKLCLTAGGQGTGSGREALLSLQELSNLPEEG